MVNMALPIKPTHAKKATRGQLKAHNTALILRTVFRHEPVSRAKIARLTGLSRATVSELVAELLADGLVAETGQGASAGGKPPTLLRLVPDAYHVVALDLSGDECFTGALIDLRGHIVLEHTLNLQGRRGVAALDAAVELANTLITAAPKRLLGVGVGAPGLVDPERGVVLQAVNVAWRNVELIAALSAAPAARELPAIHAINDAQAAALGAYTYGGADDTENLVVVLASRGIRAGILLNHSLYYGDGFGSGEIGHVVVEPDGVRCSCGQYGCLEAMASVHALCTQAQELAQQHPTSPLGRLANGGAVTVDMVMAAWQAGDTGVASLLAAAGRYLGRAVAGLAGVLDVRRIMVAGDLARCGPAFLEPLRKELGQWVLPAIAEQTVISLAPRGDELVLLGAAALVIRRELNLI